MFYPEQLTQKRGRMKNVLLCSDICLHCMNNDTFRLHGLLKLTEIISNGCQKEKKSSISQPNEMSFCLIIITCVSFPYFIARPQISKGHMLGLHSIVFGCSQVCNHLKRVTFQPWLFLG